MVDLLTKETKHPPTEGDDRTWRAPPVSPSSGTARAALDATRPAHWAAVKLLEARGHQLWDLSQGHSASAGITPAALWPRVVGEAGPGTGVHSSNRSEGERSAETPMAEAWRRVLAAVAGGVLLCEGMDASGNRFS